MGDLDKLISGWRDTALGCGLPEGGSREADATRVDLLRALEELKAVACALQADLAADLDASQCARQRAHGVPESRLGRGVASQLGLARRTSPARAGSLLGLARALRHDLPHTAAALRSGQISEHRAQIVAEHTACLDAADRRDVDEALCADVDRVEGLGDRRLTHLVRREALRCDPAAGARRARQAEHDRSVTLTPLDDAMARLTATLPVAQADAAFQALVHSAERARAAGDDRTRGQVMADTLVERTTGQIAADAVPLTVDVVISDASLFGGAEPAHVGSQGTGRGAVPAEIARDLVARAIDAGTLAWVRRLYADPGGDLVAMTGKQRLVPAELAHYLDVRDHGTCRTPWCDQPVRDHDHVVPWAVGGDTSAANTQGLCESCNHAKQAPGWHQGTDATTGRHRVTTTTPTGHGYASTAPEPPRPSRIRPTSLDRALDRIAAQCSTRPRRTACEGSPPTRSHTDVRTSHRTAPPG